MFYLLNTNNIKKELTWPKSHLMPTKITQEHSHKLLYFHSPVFSTPIQYMLTELKHTHSTFATWHNIHTFRTPIRPTYSRRYASPSRKEKEEECKQCDNRYCVTKTINKSNSKNEAMKRTYIRLLHTSKVSRTTSRNNSEHKMNE